MKATEKELAEIETIITKAIKESWDMDVKAWEKAKEAIDYIKDLLD